MKTSSGLDNATPEMNTARREENGTIDDFAMATGMLNYFVQQVVGKRLFLGGPRVVLSLPAGVNEVERQSITASLFSAGARRTHLIERPMAAAIGAGLKVADARGSMIVDIGGGTTEVAVTSLGGIVLSSSLRSAGDELDSAIIAYMKRKHNVLIGEMTAETPKKNIGSVIPMADRGNMVIRGRNLLNGLPATLAVSSGEIREAMSEQVSRIIDCIRTTLENTPPELSSDIYDNGIMLAGGGALLSGLDLLIQQLTGIRTMIAKNPMDCVAMGIGKVIDSVGELGGIVNFRTR